MRKGGYCSEVEVPLLLHANSLEFAFCRQDGFGSLHGQLALRDVVPDFVFFTFTAEMQQVHDAHELEMDFASRVVLVAMLGGLAFALRDGKRLVTTGCIDKDDPFLA